MWMSERRITHNGRDTAGNFKVKQVDVDDVTTDPEGANVIRDDVRLGGAVEDTGSTAGQRGEHIGELVEENREDVAKVTGRAPRKRKR
jgi:hypothetical protein